MILAQYREVPLLHDVDFHDRYQDDIEMILDGNILQQRTTTPPTNQSVLARLGGL